MGEFYQSERCFRRYEKIIATALEKFPESVRFKSANREATTDSARCTNALASYRRNRWQVSNPIFDLFEERQLSCWLDRDVCVIGPAVNKDPEVLILPGAGDGTHGAIKANPTSREQVIQIINLLNDGVITNPIEIPKAWTELVATETAGMLNIAYRVELSSILLF